MSLINLVSSDGEKFPVEMDIARKSVTIKTMLEDLGMEDGKDLQFFFVKLTYYKYIIE